MLVLLDSQLVRQNKSIIKELEELFEILKYSEYSDQVKFDSSRIRGLDIYSGWIVETKLKFEVNSHRKHSRYRIGLIIDTIGNFGVKSVEDFSEAFKLEGKLSDENLLEMQHSDFNQGSGDSKNHLWAFYGPQKWEPAVAGSRGGWGFWEPSMEYIKFMIDREDEERLVASVLFTPRGIADLKKESGYSDLPAYISNTTPYGDTYLDYPRAKYASGKHYMPSKYLIEGRTQYGSNKNFPVLRYAEVLLMHAEALTNGANSSSISADEAVNIVRSRAGLSKLSGVTSSDVMDEKFAELAMEWGDRFYDSVRTGKTSHLNQNGAVYDDSKRYFPYPQAQVDLLPALQQNAK